MFILIKKLVLSTKFKTEEKPELNLGRIAISENQTKVDFQILDKYQSFSSEILRLSLIGIGAYAFLLKDASEVFKNISRPLSIISIVSFALAAACSLVHRYYSSDCMAYHIRYLRLKKFPEEFPEDDHKNSAATQSGDEKSERDVTMQLCEAMIAGSAIFLGLGTICLAISLLQTLFLNKS